MSRGAFGAVLVAGLLGVAARGTSAEQQAPSVPDLLAAAAKYVAHMEEQASAIVFEETYAQQLTRRSPRSFAERRLRSELLVVPAGDGWVGFRDVLEVDGRQVQDRADRLQTLFLTAPKDALKGARAIADEGARFNLGTIERNFNFPTVALMFLRQAHQARSMFSREGTERIDGTTTWILRFQEVARPTLIESQSGDAAASGQFWIEPGTGRIRRSRLTVEVETATGTIDVRYGPWPGSEGFMPTAMEEEVTVHGRLRGPVVNSPVQALELVRGQARYSNYRRFTVDVSTRTGSNPD